MTIKQAIIDLLNTNLNTSSKIIKRFKDDDLGPYFGTIFYWQEIKKFSEAAHEAAWKIAQKAKVAPEDDDLRDLGNGEHIISDSKLFSFIVKVDNPRKTFDQEAFIEQISRKYKLNVAELSKIAATCMKDSKPPLSKRILEVQG